MTTKKTKGAKPAAKKSKWLSLSKKTLKDLSVPNSGPKGGRARDPSWGKPPGGKSCMGVAC